VSSCCEWQAIVQQSEVTNKMFEKTNKILKCQVPVVSGYPEKPSYNTQKLPFSLQNMFKTISIHHNIFWLANVKWACTSISDLSPKHGKKNSREAYSWWCKWGVIEGFLKNCWKLFLLCRFFPFSFFPFPRELSFLI